MKKYKTILILVNLLALLVFYNYSIVQKENILANGKLIYLELATDTGRSLMQGDFMMLRYNLSKVQISDSLRKRGFVVVAVDSQSVAHVKRLQGKREPLQSNERIIEFTRTRADLHIGAEAFFIQEGNAARFKSAKYSSILVDESGNSILSGLYDAKLRKIQ